ncbi:Uncharacterised protein [Mycobacteroides abscessus subsp. abscessus]|nr:Uncharacterised protein [Mycobacteroides abscessus subsp. abscessus]
MSSSSRRWAARPAAVTSRVCRNSIRSRLLAAAK